MFFATIFSTIALGAHLSEVGGLGKYMGVGEFLVMNSLSGLYMSLLSCQPLLILRPTGPITLIIENIIIISEKYTINFWHLLACSGYFVGMWMLLIAAFEGSNQIGLLTRFTHETFAFYVCSIYIYNGVNDVISNFHLQEVGGAEGGGVGASVVMAALAGLAFVISLVLGSCRGADTGDSGGPSDTRASAKKSAIAEVLMSVRTGKRVDRTHLWSVLSAADDVTTPLGSADGADCAEMRWNICTTRMRCLLSDYAVTIAVITATLLSYIPSLIHECELGSPEDGAGLTVERVSSSSCLAPTMAQRPWLVTFTSGAYRECYLNEDESTEHGLAVTLAMAFAISIPIVFFFYIDQVRCLAVLVSGQCFFLTDSLV